MLEPEADEEESRYINGHSAVVHRMPVGAARGQIPPREVVWREPCAPDDDPWSEHTARIDPEIRDH